MAGHNKYSSAERPIVDDELTVALDPRISMELASIALRNGLSFENAILMSVANELFLQEQMDEGARLIMKKGGRYRYIDYE
jgi:hypothetical protein